MTARDQARPSERRLTARQEREFERAAAELVLPESSERLGAMLYAARERKGVDLYRAERDTKIRAKFLEALEESDFKELPGAVYTKGFLRNYALYLGLDPELVLTQWRAETGDARRRHEPTTIAPRPLEAPRGGFTFSRGLLVAAVLTLAVLAFASYIGLQLFRFAQPPGLTVAQAAVSEAAPDADSTTLSGTASPGTTVAVEALGQETYRVTADAEGDWEQVVPLKKGRNDFTITATDPETGKDSEAVSLIVTVPVAAGPEAPTLTVSSPNEGTSFTNGAIPVTGTTTGQRVVVSAAYVGPAAGGKEPAQPPTDPEPQDVAVAAETGEFSDAYQLAPGTWDLTITASGAADKTTAEMRRVSVAYTGVALVVRIRDARAWLKVWVDGELVPGYEGGRVIQPGKAVEFTGQQTIEVRTGNSGATYFTVNGARLGALGKPGQPETWLFAPPAEPEETGRTN